MILHFLKRQHILSETQRYKKKKMNHLERAGQKGYIQWRAINWLGRAAGS